MLETLKQKFNLPGVTLLHSRDKYGKLVTIKELELTVYEQDLEKAVRDFMDSYDYAMSKSALKGLCQMSKRDNTFNDFLGYKTYKVVRVVLLRNARFGVVVEFNDGTTRNVIESGLSWALKNSEDMKKYLLGGRHYFTAGGLKDSEVDFIFHGVGHSSQSELYEFSESDVIQL